MFKMFDFDCKVCGTRFEALVGRNEKPVCPCGSKKTTLIPNTAKPFTVIATLSKNKAGNVHKHQNRPREKISSQVPAKYGS